jgi:hypothetical protein
LRVAFDASQRRLAEANHRSGDRPPRFVRGETM